MRQLIATTSTTEPVLTCSPVCTSRGAILVPAPVVAEVGYLLGRAGDAKIEAAFLRSIVQQALTIVDLELADYERMAELVETYADFPLGTTDAAVVAVAERLWGERDRYPRLSSLPRGSTAAHGRLPAAAVIVGR